MAKEIICVREFKQYLLAMNCRCRGASTLLTNLLHQRKPMDQYHESWQAQYALVNLPFKEAAWIVYTECQVILFGVKTRLIDCEHREILLNPENNYVINEDDLCVYMCESPREIEDVKSLNYNYVRERIEQMKFSRQNTPNVDQGTSLSEASQSQKNPSLCQLSSRPSSRPPSRPPSGPPSPTLKQTSNGGIYNSSSSESSHSGVSSLHQNQPSSQSLPLQQFELSQLPTPRLALLTGSRKLIIRLGQVTSTDNEVGTIPMCYLLKKPTTLRELTIESAEGMSGHILVCMHHKVSNIFKFIYNLRHKTFELVCRFPKVYFMLGNCQHPEDLIKAGVKKAKQVVVMSERECLDQYQRSTDSPAIMTSYLLDLLLQDKPHDASRIVNLVEKSNIRFMHLLQGKDVAEEVDVFYTPAYAAGNVVVDSLLSNVLLSQTYYKPDIVSVIKALCGMPGPMYDKDTAHTLMCGAKVKSPLSQYSRHLTLAVMPPCFIGKSFAFLFETLVIEHEALPLGLLRAPDENMGNELSFVYTNPVSSLVMKRSDKIYLLVSPGWKFYSK
ncbi:MAG: hypothetical protein EXX96DRAFT_643825 [Benjaminiella poitrasii]|nr:MAG: hypothetical protein EXX96DRAFT_643825 [Benjaminiella poitrasii]